MPHGQTCNRRSCRLTFSSNRFAERRPALVVAQVSGDDVILCQITTQSRRDLYSVPLAGNDFERGRLNTDSFIAERRALRALFLGLQD